MAKNLLLFGVTGDLGKGITKVLSEKDYDTIYLFASRPIENLKQNQKYIQVDDLSKEENVQKAFEQVPADKSAEYFLYTTIGGFAGGKDIIDTEYNEWLKMFNLNLNISFLLAKHFSKLVRETLGGTICFTSAVTGLQPAENKAAYGASKNGLIYLTKTLAKEGRKYNFTANAIAPFIIDTPANREWVEDKSKLVNTEAIGKLAYSIFENYKILSGNILETPGTLHNS